MKAEKIRGATTSLKEKWERCYVGVCDRLGPSQETRQSLGEFRVLFPCTAPATHGELLKKLNFLSASTFKRRRHTGHIPPNCWLPLLVVGQCR